MSTVLETQATRVSPQQVAAAKQPIDLVDVRTPGEYAAVHASGARLVPLGDLDAAAIVKSRQASSETPIYLICKSGQRATKAAAQFAGLANVAVVEGGTDAWVAAGLPVVRGKGVISLERQVRIAAGFLVLASAILAMTVNIWIVGLAAFVGAGLMFAGITDTCGMAMLLARMPWNTNTTCTKTP